MNSVARSPFPIPVRRKVHEVRINKNIIVAHQIEVNEFDRLLDEGYDDILVITLKDRFIASLEDWLDYGYVDLDGDAEVRVLHRSMMGRV